MENLLPQEALKDIHLQIKKQQPRVLHQHLLGQKHTADHPEIERTYQLFAGIIVEARTTKGLDKRESYHCGRIEGRRLEDPNYTLRAWRGVVTYLLRQYDFLYE